MALTNEQLAEIRKRVNSATRGPWEWDGVHYAVDGAGGELNVCVDTLPHDSEFISHARQDVPALLTEVERLRNVLDYINELSSEFFTEEHEDNVVAIPDSERHKQTMQEIFVVSYEAVNDDAEEL